MQSMHIISFLCCCNFEDRFE